MLYAKHFTLIISFRLSEVSAEGITPLPFIFKDEKFLLRALGRQWRDGMQIQVVTLFPVIFLFHREVFSLTGGGGFLNLFHQGNLDAWGWGIKVGMSLCSQTHYKHHCQSSQQILQRFQSSWHPCFMDEEMEASGDWPTWQRPYNKSVRSLGAKPRPFGRGTFCT